MTFWKTVAAIVTGFITIVVLINVIVLINTVYQCRNNVLYRIGHLAECHPWTPLLHIELPQLGPPAEIVPMPRARPGTRPVTAIGYDLYQTQRLATPAQRVTEWYWSCHRRDADGVSRFGTEHGPFQTWEGATAAVNANRKAEGGDTCAVSLPADSVVIEPLPFDLDDERTARFLRIEAAEAARMTKLLEPGATRPDLAEPELESTKKPKRRYNKDHRP